MTMFLLSLFWLLHIFTSPYEFFSALIDLASLLIQFVLAIFTGFAVYAALTSSKREERVRLSRRPELIFSNNGKVSITPQHEKTDLVTGLHVGRLSVENIGKYPAKDVRVQVKLRRSKKDSSLPLYLNWTHIDSWARDIHPEEECTVDVFNYLENSRKHQFEREKEGKPVLSYESHYTTSPPTRPLTDLELDQIDHLSFTIFESTGKQQTHECWIQWKRLDEKPSVYYQPPTYS